MDIHDVYFNTVKKTDGSRKSWNIKDVNESHDQCILKSILFLHAWTGCDTTSGAHEMGENAFIVDISNILNYKHFK